MFSLRAVPTQRSHEDAFVVKDANGLVLATVFWLDDL
jgi:hypothetical protein